MASRLQLNTGGLPQIYEGGASATASPARRVMAARILNMAAKRSDEQGKQKINESLGEDLSLEHAWDFWYDRQDRKPKAQTQSDALPEDESYAQDIATASYEDRLVLLHADIRDIPTFWKVFNNTNVQHLHLRDSIHLFHRGTKPVWEDSRNAKGGSWTFRVPKEKAAQFWMELSLLAIGDRLQAAVATQRPSFNDDVCGISYSVRYTSVLITIWNRDGDNEAGIASLLKAVLGGLSPELAPSQNQCYYKKHSEHAGFTGLTDQKRN